MIDNNNFLKSMIKGVDRFESMLRDKLVDKPYYFAVIDRKNNKFKVITSQNGDNIDFIYKQIFYENFYYVLNHDLDELEFYYSGYKCKKPY